MKIFNKKISLYWKCQIIGWAVFLMVVTVFDELVYRDSNTFLPFAISIYIFGFLFSHLIKITIVKQGILKKKFAAQVIDLSLLSFLYSFLGTFTWMVTMVLLGYWKIEGKTPDSWLSHFIHGLFFHLFLVLLTFSGWVLIYFLFHYVKGVRREEQLKMAYQIQTAELEAKALRAQMNPHFIFNSLNSIKSLILDDEKDKAVTYLTIFSKLIRTLLNNVDKREISLYDEIETCKLYLQLESMRFDSKFSYSLNIDEKIDLKSVQVPALIIQPFIENAIWHGIMPRNGGGVVTLGVVKKGNAVEVIVDDDGVGREASKQNKTETGLVHHSKGINLTQSRLELINLLQQRQAKLEVVDKKDELGIAKGTTIIILFKEELV